MESVYILYSEIYYEPLYKKYFTILTLNKEPNGELKKYIKHIRVTSPSTKEETLNSAYCIIAISTNLPNNKTNNKTNNNTNNITLEQLDDFTEFIINNNYIINNIITQQYKNVLSINNNKRPIYAFTLKD
jgi:hypothetical protein